MRRCYLSSYLHSSIQKKKKKKKETTLRQHSASQAFSGAFPSTWRSRVLLSCWETREQPRISGTLLWWCGTLVRWRTGCPWPGLGTAPPCVSLDRSPGQGPGDSTAPCTGKRPRTRRHRWTSRTFGSTSLRRAAGRGCWDLLGRSEERPDPTFGKTGKDYESW